MHMTMHVIMHYTAETKCYNTDTAYQFITLVSVMHYNSNIIGPGIACAYMDGWRSRLLYLSLEMSG